MRPALPSRIAAAVLLAFTAVARGEETAAMAPAQPSADLVAKWEKSSVDELIQAVNRLAGESVQRAQAVEESSRQMDVAWQDPANTSPEIEELRRTVQEQEQRLLATRTALRRMIEELPALRAQREALEREAQRLSATKSERVYVQQLLQARLKANRGE